MFWEHYLSSSRPLQQYGISTMESIQDAIKSLNSAWPPIRNECLSVLGSELHYQAMIYHCLRTAGKVPVSQIGMNVKMWVENPVSDLFKKLVEKKHKDFQGGFEPIPDVVVFKPVISGDWRRRNNEATLFNMLLAIEVKASERSNSRLQPAEIMLDIKKLAAHQEEVIARGADVVPVMLVIDSALEARERMTDNALSKSLALANSLGVAFMYISQNKEINTLKNTNNVLNI